jgi:hypothetical protein
MQIPIHLKATPARNKPLSYAACLIALPSSWTQTCDMIQSSGFSAAQVAWLDP